MNEHETLGIREAAQKLGITYGSMYLRVASGQWYPGQFKDENGHWRIPAKDVEAELEAREKGKVSQP